MYKIKFVIGDWSLDGHGESEAFIINSNQPVEYLREVHFKAEEILGFDIGDLCNRYGEDYLTKDVFLLLKKLSILPQHISSIEITEDNWAYNNNKYYIGDPEDLLCIWLGCLIFIDKTLELTLPTLKTLPTMHFFGMDNEGRHLKVPGYGVFS